MSKAKNLRDLSEEELNAQCEDLRKEIFTLKNSLSSKESDVKPYQIQMKKKDVARILTVLRERELQKTA